MTTEATERDPDTRARLAGPASESGSTATTQVIADRSTAPWKISLPVAVGLVTALSTAATMAVDRAVAALLAPFPTATFLGEALVFALSALMSAAMFWIGISRPLKLLALAVERLAESSDDTVLSRLKAPIREMHYLVKSVLLLRAKLIADEQRAIRLASDMMQVAKASGDWIWREDANHRFTEFLNVNASAASTELVSKRIGMTRREIANHPDDRSALDGLQEVLDAHGTFRDFRYRRIEPDQSVHWYSTNGIPIYDDNDGFAGYRGTSRDITNEVRREEQQSALIVLNSRLAAAIGQASDGVILTEPTLPDMPIAYVNPAYCRMTGRDASAMVGFSSQMLYGDFADEMVRTRLTESIEAGRRYQGLVPTSRQDGTVFWNDLSVSPVRDEHGFSAGFVWTFGDVTSQVEQEQKEAEAAERTAQQQKLESLGTLAGGIAHDLNNTLVPVLGLSKLLLDMAPADDPNRRQLQAIVGASERARGLVRQILDFSRIGSGNLEVIDITAEIAGIRKVIRAGLPATAVLKFDINAPALHVRFEPTKLYQILMNICVNSFDALQDGKGRIVVSLREDATKNRALLTIRDDGIGMDKATLTRCMEPFFTTKGVGKGTGLGLSIIHGIVTGAGGEILLESEVGKGTTVSIELPIAGPVNGQTNNSEKSQTEEAEK